MNEQDDKPLHDWLRQSLDTYRPSYDPHNWAQLRHRLKRRNRWRNRIIVCFSLLLLSLLGWLILPTQKANRPKIHSVMPVNSEPTYNKADIVTTSPSPKLQLASGTIRKPGLINRRPLSNYLFQKGKSRSEESVTFLASRTKIRHLPSTLTEQIRSLQTVAFSPEEMAIKQQMTTGEFGSDSASYRVVERNLRQWPNAVFVCDLTTSMYPYTTQLFALLKRYANNPSIKGMVFFTDCDSLGQQTYSGGPVGRMFVTRERNVINTLPILIDAARNTVWNKDDAENDIEALLFAQKEFPEAKHLILVADNISTVKDMALLNKVRKPVHVVLCGTTGSSTKLAFQPDYYAIASQTNGSLHTPDDDLSPKAISANATLRVGSHYYRYNARKKQFKLTNFDHRPKRFLHLIWL